MRKKLLMGWIVLMMFAMVLAGCAAKSTHDAANSTNAASTGTPMASNTATTVKKNVELTIWADSKELAIQKTLREQFTKEHPYIKFNVITKDNVDLGQEWVKLVVANNAPDVGLISMPTMDKNIKSDVLLPLNDLIAKWDDYKFIDPALQKAFTKNGKIYAISYNTLFPMMFGYNKKLFQEAGITSPPKTWDEMMTDAKLLTKPDKQQYGYGQLTGQWTEWFFQYYVWQAGGDLTKRNDDDTLMLTFTDPAVIKAANYYKALHNAKVTPADVTLKFEDLVKAFAAGKIGMMPFAGDWVSWTATLGMKIEDIGLASFPAGPAGGTQANIGGGGFVINPKISVEKQEAGMEWIKFNLSKEYITSFIKDQEKNGAVNAVAISRTDMKLSEIVKVDTAWNDVLENAKKVDRPEFYAKGTVGKYVDQAVQKITLDPNSDPEKEFKAAAEAAKIDVDGFNKGILAAK